MTAAISGSSFSQQSGENSLVGSVVASQSHQEKLSGGVRTGVSVSGAQSASDLPTSASLLDGDVVVSWTLIPADGLDFINEQASIEIQLLAKTNSWVGIGFNAEADSMTGSDVYAGWVFPNGTFQIDDYLVGSKHSFGCSNKGVCLDVDQACANNILTSSGSYSIQESEEVGLMRLNFTRKLVTSDKCDYEIPAGRVNIIVAMGRNAATQPGSITGHGPNHDAATVTFYNAAPAPVVSTPPTETPVTVAPVSEPVNVVEPVASPVASPVPVTATPIAAPVFVSPPSLVAPPVGTQPKVVNKGSAAPFAGYKLDWTVYSPDLPFAKTISAEAFIDVTIEAKTDSWVGYGWNSDETMTESDVVIGLRMNTSANSIEVADYKIGPQKRLGCGTNGEPNGVCLDTTRGCQDNILTSSVQYTPAQNGEETGTMIVNFRRLLNTGDSPSCDYAITQGLVSVVYAMGKPGADLGKLSSHGKDRHATDTLTFVPTPAPIAAPEIFVPIDRVPEASAPLAPVATPRPCPFPTAAEFEHVMPALEGRYKLFWTLKSVEDRLHLAMIAEGSGWVGFGVSTATGEMVGSEAIIGWPGSPVHSYKLGGKRVTSITVDPSIPIMDSCSAQYVDENSKTWTVVRATRGVTAGDNAISMTGATPIVVAYGPDHELMLVKHTSDNRERMTANFVSGTSNAAKPDARKIAHGALMFISWGIILQFGAIFARYAKPLPNALWFKVHRIVQFGGFAIAVAGFILAIVMSKPPHFQTTSGHAQVGLTVMILGVIQIVVAIFRPNPANVGQNKSIVRVLWEFSHWWIGRLSLLLAVVAIFLGLVSIRAPHGFIVAWSVIVGIACAAICGLELYRKFAIDRPQQAYEYVRLNPSDGMN